MKGINILIVIFGVIYLHQAEGLGEVIFAVNAGGPAHIDSYGIRYQADKLTEGISSDFGMRMDIKRAYPKDQALYQTERYGTKNFGYDFPIKTDGDYVLVLKFCEVYFQSPYQKVFNVVLNSEHLVVSDLDIFKEVGYGTAHDEYVEFKVKDNARTFVIDNKESEIRDGRVRVKFVMGGADNPKINALYVMKGSIQDVPKLPPPNIDLPEEDLFEDEEDDEEVSFDREEFKDDLNIFTNGLFGKKSGPAHEDPWDDEPFTLIYAPVFGSLVASGVALYILFSFIK